MILCAVLAIGWQRPPAESVLRDLVTRYQKLKSLTVKVVHHADFLSDVRDSIDSLSWLAPKRFELVSNKDSIPKLTSDGKKLTTYIPNIAPLSQPLAPDKGTGARQPWEDRGGILFSILMRGPMAEQWLHPGRGIKVSFDYGKTLHWHDLEVSEIDETLVVTGAIEHLAYYLSANYQHLRGIEVSSGPESAWTQYDEEADDPPLPKALGSVPGKG